MWLAVVLWYLVQGLLELALHRRRVGVVARVNRAREQSVAGVVSQEPLNQRRLARSYGPY